MLLRKLAASHVMISFFNDLDVSADDPRIAAAQYLATKGFFADYNARLDEAITDPGERTTFYNQNQKAIRAAQFKIKS